MDTYSVPEAVRTAVKLAGGDLGAVRIDSGDLGVVAFEVREQLDSLGADRTRIVVTGDLDEYAIAALAVAPVDGYGVGTKLVTGSGAPTANLVYKLVDREDASGAMKPVAKTSVGKPSKGGRKWAYRSVADGVAVGEVVSTRADESLGRPLLTALVRGGEIVGRETLDEARARHHESMGGIAANRP